MRKYAKPERELLCIHHLPLRSLLLLFKLSVVHSLLVAIAKKEWASEPKVVGKKEGRRRKREGENRIVVMALRVCLFLCWLPQFSLFGPYVSPNLSLPSRRISLPSLTLIQSTDFFCLFRRTDFSSDQILQPPSIRIQCYGSRIRGWVSSINWDLYECIRTGVIGLRGIRSSLALYLSPMSVHSYSSNADVSESRVEKAKTKRRNRQRRKVERVNPPNSSMAHYLLRPFAWGLPFRFYSSSPFSQAYTLWCTTVEFISSSSHSPNFQASFNFSFQESRWKLPETLGYVIPFAPRLFPSLLITVSRLSFSSTTHCSNCFGDSLSSAYSISNLLSPFALSVSKWTRRSLLPRIRFRPKSRVSHRITRLIFCYFHFWFNLKILFYSLS